MLHYRFRLPNKEIDTSSNYGLSHTSRSLRSSAEIYRQIIFKKYCACFVLHFPLVHLLSFIAHVFSPVYTKPEVTRKNYVLFRRSNLFSPFLCFSRFPLSVGSGRRRLKKPSFHRQNVNRASSRRPPIMEITMIQMGIEESIA